MRQTVVIVTALMIALLAVSGFIVAGSVEQMRQLTQKNTLMDEMTIQIKQQTQRADEMEAQNGALSASLETAERERDEALAQQQELADLVAESDAQRALEGKEQEALARQAEALADDYDALLLERDALVAQRDTLTEERDALLVRLSQTQEALDDASARAQALENQLETLMEESAQTALAYEQKAQEDAQTIETLAAQAESLAQASAGGGAPSAAPALTPPPAPTVRPLYTIPLP